MKKITIIISSALLSMMLSLQAQPSVNIADETQCDVAVMVDDTDSVSVSSNVEFTRLKNDLTFYQLLVSPEVTVFDADIDQAVIPQCLKEHFAAIRKIVLMREQIEKVEETVKQLTLLDTEESNSKQTIRDSIEQDMFKLYDMYSEIKSLNLSTFSEEQKKYFKPGLTERYNTIYNKYFE